MYNIGSYVTINIVKCQHKKKKKLKINIRFKVGK